MPSTNATRRRLLAAVGAGTGSLLAGCASLPGGGGGATLGCLHVANYHWEPHTVDVRVERGGDVVHASVLDLPAATYAGDERTGSVRTLVDREWDGAGTPRVVVETADGARGTTDLADLGRDCVDVTEVVRVRGARGPESAPDAEVVVGTLVSDCGGAFCPDAETTADG